MKTQQGRQVAECKELGLSRQMGAWISCPTLEPLSVSSPYYRKGQCHPFLPGMLRLPGQPLAQSSQLLLIISNLEASGVPSPFG